MNANNTTSQRRQIANAANARHSTGPRTDAGKAQSSMNALKSGLTGRTVLLPTDDVLRFEQHVAAWVAELQPEGPREAALVQAIADSHWRTDRVVALEFALFAQGRLQFAELFAEHEPSSRDSLLEAHVYLTYERQLRNLSVQESRLRRAREKDMKDLREIQEERRASAAAAAVKTTAPARTKLHAVPRPDGFEFSTPSERPESADALPTPHAE